MGKVFEFFIGFAGLLLIGGLIIQSVHDHVYWATLYCSGFEIFIAIIFRNTIKTFND